ncbi:MAG: calcium-binding protein [Methylobacter sp.]|nr:calcium-binding protein [Methylobacter sp.]
MALTKPANANAFGTVSTDDYVVGTFDNDTISGGATSLATVWANDGSDTLEGGLGDDQYVVNDTTDVITEYAGEGIDTVFTTVNYTLLTELENIAAAGVTGSLTTSSITLTGNAKDNILDGVGTTTGADTLIGGAGNDTYFISSGDKINADTSGIDTVVADFAINLSSAAASTNFAASSATVIENVTLTGSSGVTITGNSLNNRLTGNTGANSISGGTGNDILDTGATSSGTDSLNGGDGNDTYIIRSGVTATITDSSGTDTVKTFATFIAAAGIENVTALGTTAVNITANTSNNLLIGNSAVNTITADAGNDTLNGGGGADILIGGTGNDLYIADASDTVTESSGAGTDTVQLGGTDTTTVFALTDNVETLTMTGALNLKASAAAGAGVGGSSVLSTTAHSMTGNSGTNTLTGGSGNDTLNGGTGNDVLTGGLGNDTYYLDVTTDSVTEIASQGTDTIILSATSGTLTVPTAVETVTLSGTSAISATASALATAVTMTGNGAINSLTGGSAADVLTGGAGDDVLVGNADNDTLNGGTGNDALTGGLGNDKYYVDSASDTVTEAAGAGTDTIESTVSLSLNDVAGIGIDNLTLAGTAATGTGNAIANTITGNGSSNTLDGAGGSDVISAGSGDDLVIGGAAADSLTGGSGADIFKWTATTAALFATETGSTAGTNVTFAAGTVGDKVTDFVSGTDQLQFDVAGLTGGTSDTLGEIAKGGTVTGAMRFVHITDTVVGDAVDTGAGAVTILNALTTSAVAISDSFIAAMDNDTSTFLYYVKQVSTADLIAAQDVTLIGVINGLTLADGDFVSFIS